MSKESNTDEVLKIVEQKSKQLWLAANTLSDVRLLIVLFLQGKIMIPTYVSLFVEDDKFSTDTSITKELIQINELGIATFDSQNYNLEYLQKPYVSGITQLTLAQLLCELLNTEPGLVCYYTKPNYKKPKEIQRNNLSGLFVTYDFNGDVKMHKGFTQVGIANGALESIAIWNSKLADTLSNDKNVVEIMIFDTNYDRTDKLFFGKVITALQVIKQSIPVN